MTASNEYLAKLEDFRRYLLTLTNSQVWGVYDKERAAHRDDETCLARHNQDAEFMTGLASVQAGVLL